MDSIARSASICTEQPGYPCPTVSASGFPDAGGAPRLAGQREDYLLKTLREYKSGTRRAYEPIMLEALQPIDDAQLVEFAYYLSRLR